jgi:hypothetical protein
MANPFIEGLKCGSCPWLSGGGNEPQAGGTRPVRQASQRKLLGVLPHGNCCLPHGRWLPTPHGLIPVMPSRGKGLDRG